MAGKARWAFGTLLQMGDGGEEAVVGGGSTTLDAAASSGDTVLSVASETNFTAGDLILIGGAGGEHAVVQSAAVGELTLEDGLELDWPLGATVVEVEAESFTTIAEVKDIDGPEGTMDTEDVTPHDAVGGWEEIIPTILRSGEVTFDLNFVPGMATHQELRTLMKNRTLRNFRLLLPTTPQYGWPFAAYVTRAGHAFPVGGAMNMGATLKITGELADPAIVS